MNRTLRTFISAVTASAAVLVAPIATPAHAATITVTNLDDAGPGSLRAAIDGSAPGDQITFDAGLSGTIALATDLDIVHDLTISGNDDVTIDRTVPINEFSVAALSVTGDSDLTVRRLAFSGNGRLIDVVAGGNIRFDEIDAAAGPIEVDDAERFLLEDSTANGTVLKVEGVDDDIVVRRTDLSSTTDYGYLRASGDVIIEQTSWSSVQGLEVNADHFDVDDSSIANPRGYGFALQINTASVTDSTFRGIASDLGGSIAAPLTVASAVEVAVSNSTFADHNTPAMAVAGSPTLRFDHTTFNYVGSRPAIGLVEEAPGNSTVLIRNSVVAGASGPVVARYDYSPSSPAINNPTSTVELDYVALETGAPTDGDGVTFTVGPGVLTDIDAMLQPLGSYGGTTDTMPPNPASPLVDAGEPNLVAGQFGTPEYDQRGNDRVQGNAIDIGAVEVGVGRFVSNASGSVNESAGTATITVERVDDLSGFASVKVRTVAGTADAGDYVADGVTLDWADGVGGTQSFVVDIIDDDVYEDDETFQFELFDPIGAAVDQQFRTVTILNDDATPSAGTFNISGPGTVDEDAGNLAVSVERSGGSFGPATVRVRTIAGSASSGQDFEAAMTQLTWENDESGTKSIVLPIIDDHLNEGDESFTVELYDATGSSLGTSTLVVTIIDDDVAGIVPLQPVRLHESREEYETDDGEYEKTGMFGPGETRTIKLAGREGVPADAAAVVVNLTVVAPIAAGHATLHPCVDGAEDAVSTINFVPGDVAANSSVVPLTASGEVCLYTTSAADFILDISGYVPAGSLVKPIDPQRYLETRPGFATFDGAAQAGGQVAAGTMVEVAVAGRGDVPADATAVMLNATAVFPVAAGHVTIYPCTADVPEASTLNYQVGQVVPNGGIYQLSDRGTICLYTHADTHLLLDIAGYVSAEVADVVTVEPTRVFESREPDFSRGPNRLVDDEIVTIDIRSLPDVPADATAAIVNAAVIFPDGPGHLVLFPCGAPVSTSSLNYSAGTVRANNAIIALSDEGTICAQTLRGTDLIVDLTGYLS